MSLNRLANDRSKFDIEQVIGDIVIHDKPPHAGQIMLDCVRTLVDEQITCRIPKKYRTRIIRGRINPNPASLVTIEQLGYDYWFYLPPWTK